MSEITPKFLTVSQTAARLGVSERTITRRCIAGTLAAKRTSTESGTAWLVDAAAISADKNSKQTISESISENSDMTAGADNFSPSGIIVQSEEIETLRHDVDQLRAIVTTDIGNRLREALAELPNKDDITEAITTATGAAIAPLIEQINNEREKSTKHEVIAAVNEVFAPYIAQLDKVALDNRKLHEQLAQERALAQERGLALEQERAMRPFWQRWRRKPEVEKSTKQ